MVPLPSNRSPRLPGALLALAVLVQLWVPAFAASLSAVLDRDVVGLGDTVTLKITVEGGTGRERPRLPNVPGLRFTEVANTVGMTFQNGRQSITLENSFAVTPSRLGVFTLAPITAEVGTATLQAPPVQLRVVRADDPAVARRDGLDQAAFLQLHLPAREVYVGETFPAEIHLYAIGGRLQQAPQLHADGFTVGKLHDAGQEGNIRTNNRIYSRARFQILVTPARAGDLTLQAANCILDVPLPRRLGFSDVFDDSLFGMRETRRFNLATTPASLKVLPLPKMGVPPGFSGAVGEYEISLVASPTAVKAGDPITARVRVQGRGNFDSVQLPDPGWQGFRFYPPTVSFEAGDPLGLSGARLFEQVVTPELPGITALPPLEFSFFSPAARAYRTVRSAPVPLQVEAGAATPEVAAVEGDPENAMLGAPSVRPLKAHLGEAVTPLTLVAAQPWYLPLTVLPFALWAGTSAWCRRRDRLAADPEVARRRDAARRMARESAALQQASAREDRPEFFAALFRLLQEAVADRVGMAPGAVTEGVLDDHLPARGVPPGVITSLHELFGACNQARYAPAAGGDDLEALRRRAESAVAALRAPR